MRLSVCRSSALSFICMLQLPAKKKAFDTRLCTEDYKIGLANRLHIERSRTSIS